jgi:rare lipoprotein A
VPPCWPHRATDPPGLDPALVRGGTSWEFNMSSTCCANDLCANRSCVAAEENPVSDAAPAPVAGKIVQRFAVILAAASLAACAQSSVVSKNSGFVSSSRQASLPQHRTVAVTTHRSVVFAKKPAPFVPTGETHTASQGLASFYTEGTRTANGEKFDTHDLTAAHPTLPFGTRLRVTNVASGRSVTVRVNDRGPYVAGRVVDVSYSAANALGMVGQGVAKVKLDVVQ